MERLCETRCRTGEHEVTGENETVPINEGDRRKRNVHSSRRRFLKRKESVRGTFAILDRQQMTDNIFKWTTAA